MKNTLKIAAGIMGAIAVSAALAEEVLTDVKAISISNVIGVQKIVSDKEYTPIAVCFGDTAVSSNRAVNVARYAPDLVFTANLVQDDKLYIYDHDRECYVSYTLNYKKEWVADVLYDALDPSKDMTPTADQSQPWGYGFWLYRKNVGERKDQSIYLAGQVPVGEVSITIAPATKTSISKTLIGNALGTEWNLNDNTVVNWSSFACTGDMIQLQSGASTIYRWNGSLWKKMSGTGNGKIPAGASFWYVRAKDSTGKQEAVTISFRTGL